MPAIHDRFEAALVHHGAARRTAREYTRIALRADAHATATPEVLAIWYADTVRGKSRSTQIVYRSALQHWATFREIPIPDLPRPRGAKSTVFRAALTDDEYREYASAVASAPMPVPAKTILLLLPETGLRIAEACALHWAHHTTDQRGSRAFRIVGKGDKARIVPLNDAAAAILVHYTKWRGAPGSGYVFPSDVGRQEHYSPTTVREHLQHLREARGWQGHLGIVSPHVLRHTYASRLLNRGVSLRHVQALLGHSNLGTTERYTHPDEASLHQATAALGRPRRTP